MWASQRTWGRFNDSRRSSATVRAALPRLARDCATHRRSSQTSSRVSSLATGVARELALTARAVGAAEAHRVGLVTATFPTEDALMEAAMRTARALAAKSPLAVQGTKATLLHARDHSVADGLQYVGTRNAAVLYSQDLAAVLGERVTKKKPVFSKL